MLSYVICLVRSSLVSSSSSNIVIKVCKIVRRLELERPLDSSTTRPNRAIDHKLAVLRCVKCEGKDSAECEHLIKSHFIFIVISKVIL